MSKIYKDLRSDDIMRNIRQNFNIINCIDISDEFEYEDVFIYDCKIETTRIHLAMYDKIGNVKYVNLRDFPILENDIETLVGDIIANLENEIKIKYDMDKAVMDYEIYTFFDYTQDIKFIFIIDFSNQDRVLRNNKCKNIASIQLKGKSKYLN